MRLLPPEIVTPPEGLPVSREEAKQHLRVDHDLDDARIDLAIDAAVRHLDGYGGILGRALMTQTWREFRPCWPGSRTLALALAPVVSVASVTYRDSAGTVVTLAASTDYRLLSGRSSQPFLYLPDGGALPASVNEPDAIAVEYAAGYGEAEDVPAAIRHAILIMVGDMYRFTDSAATGTVSVPPLSATVDRLLSPYRRGML